MDGAAATLAAVTAVAIGALALVEGDVPLAVLVCGLAGACLGFLPYNLASPARIFLGDGGSLPIGFVVAASLMALPMARELGLEHVLAAVLLAGLPVLDTTLVIGLASPGRHLAPDRRARPPDPPAPHPARHAAHRRAHAGRWRRRGWAPSRSVWCSWAAARCSAAWSIWFVVAAAAVVLLESRSLGARAGASDRPARRARTAAPVDPPGPAAPSLVEALLIAFIAISCGLSPFLYGFYDVSVWGPIALGMLAALLGLLIARPAAPRRTALVAAGALAGLWLWALISTGWAESADQAMTEANRWLLYAALFGVLVLLLRDDRLGPVVVAAGGSGRSGARRLPRWHGCCWARRTSCSSAAV